MKRRSTRVWLLALGTLSGLGLSGCRPSADDPAGQAGELSDNVRRESAIANLTNHYHRALAAADGDRSVERLDNGELGPKAITDAAVQALTETYTSHPEDTGNGRNILTLLQEMRDPRSMPALIAALEWRNETTEEHAIVAAQTLRQMEVPEEQKAEVVAAIASALERVQGRRAVDNRMRTAFMRALGALQHRGATPVLSTVATTISEEQNFLINRMAAEQLRELEDPEATDAMIRGLFLFGYNNPTLRMNDLAGEALTRFGRPAYEPLVALLRGQNEDAAGIVTRYINAVRQRDAAAAEQMNADTIIVTEACRALGQLGYRDAFDAMVEVGINPLTESRGSAEGAELDQIRTRAQGCVVALVSLTTRNEAQVPQLREALTGVYNRLPETWPPNAPAPGTARNQLLVAMQHSYDAGLLDFLHDQAANRRGQVVDHRILSANSYAYLANREEAERFNRLIENEPGVADGGVAENFRQNAAALEVAVECDENLQCWIGKLEDENVAVVRKAAHMIARYGRGNDAAISALLGQLAHSDQFVRGDVLYALDWVATSGSQAAVEAIDTLAEQEAGRQSWNNVRELAMAVRSHLAHRSESD